MSTEKIGDLEIAQDLGFEKRSLVVQRAGWMVMVLIALLALFGLFGDGPLSDNIAGRPQDGLEVEFQRLGRRSAPQTLRFHLQTPPDPEGTIRLLIDRHYLEGIKIDSIMPEPENVEGGPDAHTFEFISKEGETTVSLKIRPEAIGSVEGRAWVENAPPVTFRQFVYP